MTPGVVYRPDVAAGAFALDGERELTFGEADEVSIRLEVDAFRTVNVPGCMAYAVKHGLLARQTNGRAARGPGAGSPHLKVRCQVSWPRYR